MNLNHAPHLHGESPQAQAYPPPGRLTRQRAGLLLMNNAQFMFRTLEDAENIAVLAANCFPEPERVVNGLAELMFNAVEHGNLGIGYELKTELCQLGNWRSEVESRLELPQYRDRVAEMTLARRDGGIYVIITDQGEGFDWKSFLKIDPARAGIRSGRGIAMASSVSFDKVSFNEQGNKVVAYVAETSALNW